MRRFKRAALAATAIAGTSVLALSGAPAASAADGCSNAEFRVGPSALLPDCRAYELVTPADKGGYTLMAPNNSRILSSVSGDQAAYNVVTPLPGSLNGHVNTYVSERTSTGWKTRPMLPEICREDQSGFPGPGSAFISDSFSWDLRRHFFASVADSNCDPNDHNGRDTYSFDGPGSEVRWWSQNGQPKTVNAAGVLQANSADGEHVVFSTSEKLVLPLESARSTGNGLYHRTNGTTVLVGLKSDGSLINACGARIAGEQNSGETVGRMSRDGRVIFFNSGSSASVPECSVATDDGGQLYARIDGSRTVQISASTRSVPDARALPELMGATVDGRKAFFYTVERLTDDAPATVVKLYEYDLGPVLDGDASSGSLRYVAPVYSGSPTYSSYRALAGMSDDGSRIYFVSFAQIVPEAPATGHKLYVLDDGVVRFVSSWTGGTFTPADDMSVSPDGSKAIFAYRAPGASYSGVYLYDLSSGEAPTCISCVAGVAPSGHSTLFTTTARRPNHLGIRRSVTNDGRAFFQSRDRLAARDANDQMDVYRYADGDLQLISSGTATTASTLIGAGADGRDVFFVTNDSLLPEDFDNGDQDMYVARIGGGFPQPTGDAGTCVGDACQGAVAGTPGVLLPSTGAYVGAGNVAAPPSRSDEAVSKLTLVKGSRSVRGTSGSVRVRVSSEGKVRTSGSGLRRSTRTVKRSGTAYRVPVRLSSRAKRTLKRRGRVQVRVTVRFTPEEGKTRSKRVRVTFRKAKKSSSRSKARSQSARSESKAGERAVSVDAASDEKGGR